MHSPNNNNNHNTIRPRPANCDTEYRIGRLSDWTEDETEGVDFFENDPSRPTHQPALFDRPWSSQCALAFLGSRYLTPNDAFYVRNHAPVPIIESDDAAGGSAEVAFHVAAAESSLEVAAARTPGKKGSVDTADPAQCVHAGGGVASLSLAELEARFGTKTVTAVLQCGGSRAREDLAVHGPSGFTGNNSESITCGMIGNAQWSGVPLAKVIRALYPKELLERASAWDAKQLQEQQQEAAAAKKKQYPGSVAVGGTCSTMNWYHLEFHGADQYYASVPLSHVLDEANDCLLCTRMNGAPLPRDHGYPARVLLPGVVGARNVKWLQRVVLRNDEGLGPWNNHYYNSKERAKAHGAFQSGHDLKLQSLVLGATLRRRM